MSRGIGDLSNLSFNGREVEQLSEGIFERVFQNPQLNEFHEVKTGIKAKQQIGLFGLLGMVGTTGAAACEPTVATNQITPTQKTWDPNQIEVRLTQCIKTLLPSFIEWASKNGVNKPDMIGSAWLMFIEERLVTSMEDALLRHAWFGDTDAAHTDDSPAGLLTPGLSIHFFDAFDGLWKQIFDAVTADSDRLVAITENALGTTALQLALGASTAIDTFRSMLNNADMRLRNAQEKVFVVSQTLFDNYATYLESQSFDASFLRLESGFEILKYRNIDVIPFDFWDRNIVANENSGTVLYRPHRAILTIPENLQLGVEDESSFSTFEIWYERKEKTNYIDAEFSLDSKMIENYMFQTAY